MERLEIKLGFRPLCILPTFVTEFHARKYWTCDHDDELGQGEQWISEFVLEGLGIYLLRYSVEVSVHDSTLTEANDSVEGSLVFHDVG